MIGRPYRRSAARWPGRRRAEAPPAPPPIVQLVNSIELFFYYTNSLTFHRVIALQGEPPLFYSLVEKQEPEPFLRRKFLHSGNARREW